MTDDTMTDLDHALIEVIEEAGHVTQQAAAMLFKVPGRTLMTERIKTMRVRLDALDRILNPKQVKRRAAARKARTP